jgi:hypothetical protein
MRRLGGAILLVSLSTIGCATGPFQRNTPPPGPAMTAARPEQIVAYLNQNAQSVQSVQFTDARIQAKQGVKSFGIGAMVHYQKPRSFRLTAEALGSSQADIGSNDREFWFWLKQESPTLYRCSYDDLPRLRNMPLPIQPDWIGEGLCLQEFVPANSYQLRTTGEGIELLAQATSPQGQPLQKVTTIAGGGTNRGRIVRHQLRTPQGQEIWSAEIKEYHHPQRTGGYVIPRKVTIRSSAEKMEIDFTLEGPRVNSIQPAQARELFAVPPIKPEVDLARGPANGSPSAIQRVRGASPD